MKEPVGVRQCIQRQVMKEKIGVSVYRDSALRSTLGLDSALSSRLGLDSEHRDKSSRSRRG